jgi:hypothetical protein
LRLGTNARPAHCVRTELGIGATTLLVGCLAHIAAQKDPFMLLRAAATLPPNSM